MSIYLYVKTHNKTDLKYLGKTSSADPHKYTGSGLYWLNHLEKHGYDYRTEILLETDNKEEIKETGLFFSSLWNIVKSDEWANLKPECGDGGAPENSNLWVNDGIKEKMVKDIDSIPEGYNLGRLPVIGDRIRKNRKKTNAWNKGKQMKEESKRKLSVSKKKYHENNDIIWITDGSQEKMVKSTDEMIDGWYVGRSTETMQKISNLIWINNGIDQKRIREIDTIPDGWKMGNIKNQNGNKNPSYGKMWINNGSENKYINRSEDIPEGYVKGRLLVWR
jgi:hypothetical protein